MNPDTPTPRPSPHRARGSTLFDLLLALVVIVVMASILTVAGGESSRQASLGESIANLKQIGNSVSAYGADNADRVATFSWRAGINEQEYPDLRFAATDLDAAAYQAVYIIRRRYSEQMPRINGWISNILYSHLVLTDYQNGALPNLTFVSPEDDFRFRWIRDPASRPPGTGNLRWALSSSYELGPAYFSPDQAYRRKDGSTVQTITQGTTHNTYFVPAQPELGRRTLSEVENPEAKVMFNDQFTRHFGNRRPFFAHREARIVALMADGSAGLKASIQANPGFHPNSPTMTSPPTYTYQPFAWEPPALNQPNGDVVDGRIRWTRAGLRGRDFLGPDVRANPL